MADAHPCNRRQLADQLRLDNIGQLTSAVVGEIRRHNPA
jgi:hypothetical protein